MKLSGYKQSYYDFSSSASSVSRQASFAGIALLWIFNTKTGNTYTLPENLLWPALLLVLSIFCDLLHYIVASAIWGIFHRIKEIKYGAGNDPELQASKYLTWPINLFFWSKLGFVILGYAGLLGYVACAITFSGHL
ncbi:hypothetical protein [Cellvibrio sp. pealriver]|uniref:hypothetical protein n=1 Tax=Cellvibrio sp. pealriver TaxID=1622269 RepID=UPI00066FCC9A|nr:hypothetical protein [Cellvibrio sp. pealriver]